MLREKQFENDEDEIKFFKHQKPYINSRVKFYSKLYQFLINRPQGSISKQRKFIDAEIEKLQLDYKKNLDFVKYVQEGSKYLDVYYFIRGKDEVQLITDTSHYLTDDEFSTSHDNLVAKILAYDLLINHYQQLLKDLRFNEKNEVRSRTKRVLGYIRKKGFEWKGIVSRVLSKLSIDRFDVLIPRRIFFSMDDIEIGKKLFESQSQISRIENEIPKQSTDSAICVSLCAS